MDLCKQIHVPRATAQHLQLQMPTAAGQCKRGWTPSFPSVGTTFGKMLTSNDRMNITADRGKEPSEQGESSRCIPSLIKWGYQIEHGEPRLQCMKIMLDEGPKFQQHGSRSHAMEELNKINKEPVEAVADYLTELWKHTKAEVSQRYGNHLLSRTRLEVILVFPAQWTDSAKEATLKAAEKAELGGRLLLISEPEAAAVYALHTIYPSYLEVGYNFIVCNAGSDSVDLTSCEIKSWRPLHIQESTTGTSALCGSASPNMRFERCIEERIGRRSFRELREKKPRAWHQALKDFEENVQHKFDPAISTNFYISVPGVGDDYNAEI